MKYAYIFLLLFLFSCLHRAEKISHEPGVVVAKQFESSRTNTYTIYEPYYDGKTTTTIPTFHTDYIPEKFLVVFKCAHGVVFTIDRQDIFVKLNERDTVSIDYYELLNKKGEVKDFEFIDANKTNAYE